MIIGINGRIGAGKDTLGELIQALTYKGTWRIVKYADKLKEIASLLTGIPKEKFEDQDFKKTYLPHQWDSQRIEAQIRQRQDGFDFNGAGKIVTDRMTVREFLQKLGTDAVRNSLHDNAWVNALFADYKPIEVGKDPELDGDIPEFLVYPNWIITDIRFVNEAQAIRDRGGITVRIERPNNPYPKSDHASETSLDRWDFDMTVINEGPIEKLIESAKRIVRNAGGKSI